MYVSSARDNRIYRFDPSGSVSLYAANGLLNYPRGLVVAPQGNVFVANYSGNNILKVASGSATPTVFSTGPEFKNPNGLAFDSQGTLHVSNWNGGTITRVAPDGTAPPFAGGLSNPGSLAFDSSDNLYIPCFGTHNVFKITPQGATVSSPPCPTSRPGPP